MPEVANQSEKIKQPEVFLQQMSELTTLAKQLNPNLPKEMNNNLSAEIFEDLEINE